jgi:hypothetical protein
MQMAKSPRSLTPASSRVPGWANGNIEPYEFTDIDRTVAAGLSLKGARWGRPDDTFGLAGIVNGARHRYPDQRARDRRRGDRIALSLLQCVKSQGTKRTSDERCAKSWQPSD